jgi:hypothetical protein
MQVGAGDGEASAWLLEYCRRSGCRADVIEPRPAAGLEERLQAYAQEHTYQRLLPLKAILLAGHPDLVVLDGEPNWWTVFSALNLMQRLSAERGRPFPFVLAHHVAWPYGRRDMYPNPGAVEEKHPFAYQGLDPDQAGLVEDGLNCRFAHATHEGGPHNGVLTAIEDFIANAPFDLDFWTLPFFNGLGVLAPRSRMTPELKTLIEGLHSSDNLLEAAKAVEAEAMRLSARLAEAENRLERRTGALKRARDLLARQEAEIAALRKQLDAKA